MSQRDSRHSYTVNAGLVRTSSTARRRLCCMAFENTIIRYIPPALPEGEYRDPQSHIMWLDTRRAVRRCRTPDRSAKDETGTFTKTSTTLISLPYLSGFDTRVSKGIIGPTISSWLCALVLSSASCFQPYARLRESEAELGPTYVPPISLVNDAKPQLQWQTTEGYKAQARDA
jgi:hypothetical protein